MRSNVANFDQKSILFLSPPLTKAKIQGHKNFINNVIPQKELLIDIIKISKGSKHRIINRKIKIKKLKFGKKVVEWIGTKSKADLFSTNRIKGYKTIRMVDLECIENF